MGSTSFKITEFVTSRKGVYEFLLVVDIKRRRISRGFRAKAPYRSESRLCMVPTRLSFNAVGVIPCEYIKEPHSAQK